MLSKVILSVFGLCLLLYLLTLGALYVFQEKMIFPGSKLPDDYRFNFDLHFKEIRIPVEGDYLSALHFQQSNPRGVIFFLHGNAGNLVDWTSGVEFYQRVNYDLFIIDYRGYGKSSGRIRSQQQLMNDVRAAWEWMQQQYVDKPIVIYGRSIGTALATQLAKDVDAELLVLVSPFTSMKAIARQHYPFVPLSLLRYPLETDRIIQQVNMPLVIMHGDRDALISPSHSQALHRLRQEQQQNSRLLLIEGAGHGDIHQFKSYLKGLAGVLPH